MHIKSKHSTRVEYRSSAWIQRMRKSIHGQTQEKRELNDDSGRGGKTGSESGSNGNQQERN